jgi:hypothetical protein
MYHATLDLLESALDREPMRKDQVAIKVKRKFNGIDVSYEVKN